MLQSSQISPLQQFTSHKWVRDKGFKLETIEELSRGTYGIVVKIKNKSNEFVVLKMSFQCPDMGEDMSDFTQEIIVLRKLSDFLPNYVPKLYDSHIDSANQLFFIEMEYCAEGNLNDHIKNQENNKLSKKDMISLTYYLTFTLYQAHQMNLVNYDIKPLNIFIKKNNKKTHYLLGDWGSVQVEQKQYNYFLHEKIQIYNNKNSIAYSAPEIVNNSQNKFKKLTKADIYSVGKTLLTAAGQKEKNIEEILSLMSKPSEHNEAILKDIESLKIKEIYGPEMHDLLIQMLQYDSEKRPDANKILEILFHQFISNNSKIKIVYTDDQLSNKISTLKDRLDNFIDHFDFKQHECQIFDMFEMIGLKLRDHFGEKCLYNIYDSPLQGWNKFSDLVFDFISKSPKFRQNCLQDCDENLHSWQLQLQEHIQNKKFQCSICQFYLEQINQIFYLLEFVYMTINEKHNAKEQIQEDCQKILHQLMEDQKNVELQISDKYLRQNLLDLRQTGKNWFDHFLQGCINQDEQWDGKLWKTYSQCAEGLKFKTNAIKLSTAEILKIEIVEFQKSSQRNYLLKCSDCRAFIEQILLQIQNRYMYLDELDNDCIYLEQIFAVYNQNKYILELLYQTHKYGSNSQLISQIFHIEETEEILKDDNLITIHCLNQIIKIFLDEKIKQQSEKEIAKLLEIIMKQTYGHQIIAQICSVQCQFNGIEIQANYKLNKQKLKRIQELLNER